MEEVLEEMGIGGVFMSSKVEKHRKRSELSNGKLDLAQNKPQGDLFFRHLSK